MLPNRRYAPHGLYPTSRLVFVIASKPINCETNNRRATTHSGYHHNFLRGEMPKPEKVLSIRSRALQSRDAIELLSSKWRITILHLLTPGPVRANELQRAIDGLSSKVMTQTLRGLERDGLIRRNVRNVIPPHVEYELTSMGHSVIPLLRELCHWAKANAKQRDQSRRRFDVSSQTNQFPVSYRDRRPVSG
jgi:DNA-binding HxlR family transcriptional regulator